MSKNNDSFEYLLDSFRKLTLPEGSRTRLRADLSSYADFHQVHEPAPVVSFGWLSLRRSGTALIAALLVIMLAGGTTYASERALPGDALYPVKVRITESVQLALAPTPHGKAEAHADLAERRLDEAAELAVASRLDERTEQYLEQKFSKHVDDSLAAADELLATGRMEDSLNVRSRLEARLEAHADILDLVEDHLDDAGEAARDQRALTQELLDAVKLRQEVVSETRLALERDLEDKVTQTQTLALVTKVDTEGARSAASGATTVVPQQALMHLEDAQEAIDEAKESLESDDQDDVGRAFRKVNEAKRSSEVAAILLENQVFLATLTKSTSTQATSTENAEGEIDVEASTTTSTPEID